jgi:predicted small secreted protein
MNSRLLVIASALVLGACNTMKNADRNVEINHGSVENPAADDQPTRGPARKIPPPTATGNSSSPAIPGPTQNNTGAAATTTQDRWNSSPPNNAVPSAAPPNQQ